MSRDISSDAREVNDLVLAARVLDPLSLLIITILCAWGLYDHRKDSRIEARFGQVLNIYYLMVWLLAIQGTFSAFYHPRIVFQYESLYSIGQGLAFVVIVATSLTQSFEVGVIYCCFQDLKKRIAVKAERLRTPPVNLEAQPDPIEVDLGRQHQLNEDQGNGENARQLEDLQNQGWANESIDSRSSQSNQVQAQNRTFALVYLFCIGGGIMGPAITILIESPHAMAVVKCSLFWKPGFQEIGACLVIASYGSCIFLNLYFYLRLSIMKKKHPIKDRHLDKFLRYFRWSIAFAFILGLLITAAEYLVDSYTGKDNNDPDHRKIYNFDQIAEYLLDISLLHNIFLITQNIFMTLLRRLELTKRKTPKWLHTLCKCKPCKTPCQKYKQWKESKKRRISEIKEPLVRHETPSITVHDSDQRVPMLESNLP